MHAVYRKPIPCQTVPLRYRVNPHRFQPMETIILQIKEDRCMFREMFLFQVPLWFCRQSWFQIKCVTSAVEETLRTAPQDLWSPETTGEQATTRSTMQMACKIRQGPE